MRAAVVEHPPQDALMGGDCPELKELLKEALIIKQEVAVVTRQQATGEDLGFKNGRAKFYHMK